jgi:NADH-ubiquinone oxidoreductase chain 5
MSVLLILGLFTSLYAGLNTIFEVDLKKLIALRTLSHLGFILTAYSLGIVNLAYFHILTHAIFKSTLFMTMGDIITNTHHSQDTRFLSSGLTITPSSSRFMLIPILNLLGIPSLSGYFRKDLILEASHYSSTTTTLLQTVLYLNVVLTYYYTYCLVNYSMSSSKSLPFTIFHTAAPFHNILLLIITIVSLALGNIFLSLIIAAPQIAAPTSLK